VIDSRHCYFLRRHYRPSHVTVKIEKLTLSEILVSETSTFSSQELYPCSLQCASLRTPCATCLSPPPFPSACTSYSCLVPRHSLQLVYIHFLDALRDRLVEDVCNAARKVGRQHVTRLKRGFLLERPSVAKFAAREWLEGWKCHAFRFVVRLSISILV
jgi:mediator of RNA polymerase II transcription subunit 13